MGYFSHKFRKVEDARKKLFLSSASSLVRLTLAEFSFTQAKCNIFQKVAPKFQVRWGIRPEARLDHDEEEERKSEKEERRPPADQSKFFLSSCSDQNISLWSNFFLKFLNLFGPFSSAHAKSVWKGQQIVSPWDLSDQLSFCLCTTLKSLTMVTPINSVCF